MRRDSSGIPDDAAERGLSEGTESFRVRLWLLWLFCVDVQDVERVFKLVCYFHAPFPTRRELSVYALQHLSRRDGCFLPGSIFIWQFLAFVVEIGSIVIDVEKIPGHRTRNRAAKEVPTAYASAWSEKQS
jgi:hypothetical protein